LEKKDFWSSHWMKGTGPYAEVALSSRVRLGRNIRDVPFPYLASNAQTEKTMDLITKAASEQEEKFNDFDFQRMEDISPLERQVMVEKHLISPLLAKEVNNSGVLLRKDEAVSIMINEEDQLRIQAIYPGLQLEKAWEDADTYDNLLEANLDYAFHERYGYLTACPTNVGTGLRASVMLHLPALIMTKQFNRILGALPQVGVAVRGLYGEGTEIIGNLVQISNQITLGHSEKEIIRNLFGVTRQVIEQENASRQMLLNENREMLEDKSWRALGLMKYARLLSSQEAMQLLSDLRLGFELGLVPQIDRSIFHQLLVLIRPSCLQYLSQKELSDTERDEERARQIREHMQNIGEPE